MVMVLREVVVLPVLVLLSILAFVLSWRAREGELSKFLTKTKLIIVELTGLLGFMVLVLWAFMHELEALGFVK